MLIREVCVRSILSPSKVFDYALNPYVGCQHGCVYCYARFMRRFAGHREPWGRFVDIKINAPELLEQEIKRKQSGRVWISGVCDPYQPVERRYEQTRRCLEILIQKGWPITIQTKSPLVLRDLELFKQAKEIEIGLTVTTRDEQIRQLFEPNAPPIKERINALGELHLAGLRTYAMIAPLLPGAENLVDALGGKVDYVLIDKMNYHYGDWVYKKHNLETARGNDFFLSKAQELARGFMTKGLGCRVLF